MSNHLIIGLGGTGGNIIRSFRKTVYQAFSSDLAPNVNLRYLYVDSSDEFMKQDDPSWKILGHSVQIPQRSQLLIDGINLKSVIDNLNQYPSLKPWLGNREDWRDILNAADAAKVVGGQKRRLGRFLFATNVGKFRDKVMEFVAEMQQDRSRGFTPPVATTFHVCCGLAGGTGSGAVVDVICQIRLAFPDPQHRILLYALLPERNPAAGRAGPNYHANGYAALVELNALGIGSWQPHNILSRDGARLNIQDPFNCCYLFSDENEANVAVSLSELGDITASFLFQKIVQEANINWGDKGSTINRQEIYELGSQAKTPEYSARGVARRSRAFFSFGIKQIAYPEVEIREFLTYSFAVQAVRQLLFNRWAEGEGFKDEPVNQSYHEFVRVPATLTQWYLTDDRLTLSEGILPAEITNKNWKPIGEFWKALIPNYVTEVLDRYKNDYVKMLPEFTKHCEVAFAEQYRSTGVNNFYETKRKDMTDHVRELRGRIERDLFSSWRTGERSMHDIDRLVVALIESLEERLGTIDSKVSKVAEESDVYKANEDRITENRKQWARLGILSVTLGKHKNILNAQAEALITRYTLRTRLQGFRYARELVQRLIQEFNILSKDIASCKLMLTDSAAHFKTALDGRLQDGGQKDLSKPMIREYDAVRVRGFVRDMTTDRSLQRRQTSAARERLVLLLGDRLTFANFSAKISMTNFEDTVSASCKDEAAAAHADVVALSKERGGVLDVNLIDFLRREYEGNEDQLNSYARNTMNMAKNYLKLSSVQKQLVGPGIPSANNSEEATCSTFVTIVAPKVPESAEFRTHFCDLLKNANKVGLANVVSNDTRPQEITILSITNVFPARFVEIAEYLKQKYDLRRSGENPKRAFLELHSEGEEYTLGVGQELYDLYPETYAPADVLPWLELAQALDLIEEGKDFTTGRKLIKLKIRDKSGLPEPPMDLGTDIESVVQDSDPATVEELKSQVQNILMTDYIRIEKREQIAKTLYDRVLATSNSVGADAPRYKRELTAYKTTRRILELEN
jgi:hypothetical protein